MKKWDSIDSVFYDYVQKHSTYNNILFSRYDAVVDCKLHPLFVMSQLIVDSLIEEGKTRIAIIMPDDECEIFPLAIAKYFQYIQDDPSYADSIFEGIVPGQHVKLGNAIAEFLEIDQERGLIKYRVGKESKSSSPIINTTPISNYHLLLGKTEADVSTASKWYNAVKKVKKQLSDQGMAAYLDIFKQKRTGVKKTITVFSKKNTAKKELASLIVNGEQLDNVLAFGELVDEKAKPYVVLNKGKLDCLPGVSVVNKLSTLKKAISELGVEVFSLLYFSQDKFQEIVDNLDAFKKILKTKLPTIVFVPENEFEKYDILKDLGFVFWQNSSVMLCMIAEKGMCFSSLYKA